MKIGIVNDSAMAREALKRISVSAGHVVAWIANDGSEALQYCISDRPDLVLMDLKMPIMDGVESTRRIMAEAPCPIVVVTSSVDGNVALVYDAMGAGALDAVNTPVLGAGQDISGARMLIDKIDRIGRLQGIARPRTRSTGMPPIKGEAIVGPLIVIGASTGGPEALAQVLGAFPSDLTAAVVIIQHVNAEFAPGLAEWLSSRTGFPTRTIVEGDVPKPGRALLAATDDHLVMDEQHQLRYSPHPRRVNFRPSVDVFFESVAEHWPRPSVGALLTGMGADGARGLLALRQANWQTVAQDEATSIVYGMPRAAVQMNAAMEVLPLSKIGDRLAEMCRPGRIKRT
ncbi:MAG TPA: chemotaxis response regulator protein-glutamate methylesterase [Kofleriaceae bacterium]|jgi:chemotaxis response regulator CheB